MSSRGRRVTLAAGVLGVLAAFVIINSWANSPQRTTVSTVAQPQVAGAAKPGSVPLQMSNFSSVLPDNIVIKNRVTKPQGIVLERLLAASAQQRQSDQLAVTVGRLPAEGLGELSDIQLRLRNPGDYRAVELLAAPEGAYAFRKTAGFEISVFWADEQRFAAVVISGTTDRAGPLKTALDNLLENWRWQ